MRHSFKPFLISFLLSLGVLAPFVWCGLLWYDHAHAQQSEPAAQAQSGVPITPGSQGSMLLLLAFAPWEECDIPALTLLRLDSPHAQITACPLPAETVLRTPGGQTTLAESYLAAGPGRAAALLADTLSISAPLYIAAVPDGWSTLLSHPSLRLDTASLLSAAQCASLGLESTVAELSVAEAAALCTRAEQLLPADSAFTLRCTVWESALRQTRTALSAVPDSLRAQSSYLLTSLSATDLLRLESMLSYLAGTDGVQVSVQAMPGQREGQRFALNEQSLALAAQLAE